jgi:hypothetical protein
MYVYIYIRMYVCIYIFDCENVTELLDVIFVRMGGHNVSMCKILYTDIITSVKTSPSSRDKDQWSLNAAADVCTFITHARFSVHSPL